MCTPLQQFYFCTKPSISKWLQSMMCMGSKFLLTLAMSCMLKGPDTSRARPIAQQMSLIFCSVSSLRSWGGVTSEASPECTPAFSTCSDTAIHSTSPSDATASTSISYRGTRWSSDTWESDIGWSGRHHTYTAVDIYGLVQERRNSSALAMELRLSCTNQAICKSKLYKTNGYFRLVHEQSSSYI